MNDGEQRLDKKIYARELACSKARALRKRGGGARERNGAGKEKQCDSEKGRARGRQRLTGSSMSPYGCRPLSSFCCLPSGSPPDRLYSAPIALEQQPSGTRWGAKPHRRRREAWGARIRTCDQVRNSSSLPASAGPPPAGFSSPPQPPLASPLPFSAGCPAVAARPPFSPTCSALGKMTTLSMVDGEVQGIREFRLVGGCAQKYSAGPPGRRDRRLCRERGACQTGFRRRACMYSGSLRAAARARPTCSRTAGGALTRHTRSSPRP